MNTLSSSLSDSLFSFESVSNSNFLYSSFDLAEANLELVVTLCWRNFTVAGSIAVDEYCG